MNYFPIAIRLAGRKALIVGGGAVAERKTKSLLEAGARVHIVTPLATAKLKKLAAGGDIAWSRRKVRKSDVAGVHIAVAATNDSRINELVSFWARQYRVLVNVVDKPRLSDFISPALLKDRKILLAVYTDGRDPVLSRDLKNYLKEKWDDFLLHRHRL